MNLFKNIKLNTLEKRKKANDLESGKKMSFKRDHPGHKHAYVSKRDKEVVPMICNDIGFPDLELLQMGVENVTSSVKDMRETYSFLALILIYPL